MGSMRLMTTVNGFRHETAEGMLEQRLSATKWKTIEHSKQQISRQCCDHLLKGNLKSMDKEQSFGLQFNWE
eukprot:1160163-Pelagomonas_calceolata.AAC.3